MSDEMSSHINEAKPNVCHDGVTHRVIGPAPAKSDLSL